MAEIDIVSIVDFSFLYDYISSFIVFYPIAEIDIIGIPGIVLGLVIRKPISL